MRCVIPGYLDAVAEESRLRYGVYLDQPETVCGEKIKQLTPRLLSVLHAMESPFLLGWNPEGEAPDVPEAAQFIGALHTQVDLTKPRERERLKNRLRKFSQAELHQGIGEYLRITFIDAPTTLKQSTPIASGTAWLLYRFTGEPFRMTRDAVLDSKLRELYQLLKCWQKDHGEPVTNKSDRFKVEWLKKVNELYQEGRVVERVNDNGREYDKVVKQGTISDEDLSAFAERSRNSYVRK